MSSETVASTPPPAAPVRWSFRKQAAVLLPALVVWWLDAVKDIVGKVWPYVLAGIAVGAGIHGYVPQDLMASLMGRGART